jgi:transposase InsO family protein
MAWKDPEAEKRRFIELHVGGELSTAELCRQFGISRQAGYELLARYDRFGDAAFEPQSRRPLRSPAATVPAVVGQIIEAKQAYPHWGPRKLRLLLKRTMPSVAWPARSTFGDVLKRHGLVDERRRRRHLGGSVRTPCVEATAPNVVWSIDFKGWFRLQSGQRCDPLTVTDNFSRFCIGCVALPRPRLELVKPALQRLFRRHGLPYRLRSDNGPPFGSQALGGLSLLAVWLIKHGVVPEWIEPGKPQQNGRHERFHRTLKQETAKPPRATMAAQQRAFDDFRRTYNGERPHEALADRCPADVHTPSPRHFSEREIPYEYSGHCSVRSVRSNGEIKWRGEQLFVSEVLVGESVALYASGDGEWTLRFRDLKLATYDERTRRLKKLSPMSPDNL